MESLKFDLPNPLPFGNVTIGTSRKRYVSKVDVDGLRQLATKELEGDELKFFVLTLGAGLKRAEIDP